MSPPDPRRPSPRPRRRARPDPASAGRLARELAESDPLLTGLLAAAMDAVVVVDEEQRILLFNAGAERMFEAKASEVLGQPLGRFLPERFRAAHAEQLARFARGGITSRRMGALGRVWGRRAGGEEFPAEASISQAEVGGHKLLAAILRDVSERSRAEEALRRQALILDQVHESVVALDLEGTVVFWNQAAERLFEVPREEALGRTMERILASTNILPGVVAEVIAAVRASGRHEAENEFVSASGRLGYHHTSCSLLRDAAGQPAGVIAVTQDTTERRRALEARLDAELRARRAGELAEIATLTAGIAHDVGTPMNIILGYAQMLERSLVDPADRERAAIIAEQVRRVAKLLRTLLDLARRGDRASVPVDLTRVLDDGLGFFREKLRRRGIEVARDFTRVPPVRGDADRLQQVFLNLFVNAADAMPDGGCLRVSLASPEPGVVEVRVRDTGEGIPEDVLPRVFDPFFTTKPRGQGTGLGLVVSRGIVLDHGGTIEVQSESGGGAEFLIRLPADGAAGRPPERGAGPT